jgi:SAM-dependent methyltransferase
LGTFFEQALGLNRTEVIARSLDAQTDSYGVIDVPFLSGELSKYVQGNVLDIGTGNGSFLLKVAKKHADVQFLGIDHNAELLQMAQALLHQVRLPNVQLRQTFFDSGYRGKHDVIFSRFTLEHSSKPIDFIQAAYDSLNPGGVFICIEPVYDYYDSDPPQETWRQFRERMLRTYEIWGSHPNVPKQACRWLADVGFSSIRVAINLYSPTTIGHHRFTNVVLATAAALHHNHPGVWGEPFLERLEAWIKEPRCDPFISLAHITGHRGHDRSEKNSAQAY